MPTALQFVDSHWGELFSEVIPFLHFVSGQNDHASGAFSVFFSAQNGERYFTSAVHSLVHHAVHPVVRITHLHTETLNASQCAFWTWRGRGVGWNDRVLCRTVRPKGFSRVVPAHTHYRKESTVRFPAI